MIIQYFYQIIGVLQFLIIFVLTIYIPGRVIIYKCFPDLKGLDQKVLGIVSGIAVFLITSYALAWLGFPKLQYAIIVFFVVVYAWLIFRKDRVQFDKADKKYLILIIFGSMSAVLLTAFSGLITDVGWRYTGLNAADGLVHIARIKNQIMNFPPTHPGIAGIDFRGYHYFYDFLISRFTLLFNLSPEDLYFRHFSFLSAFLFGAGLVIFTKKITSKFWAICLIVVFGYFGTGGSFVLSRLQPEFSANVSQSLSLIYDPSIYFSLGLLFAVLSILPQMLSWRRVILASMVLGVLAQIKVYVGLLGIAALVSYTIYNYFKNNGKNTKYYLSLNLVTAILTAVTFLPNNLGAGQMVFAPMLFYSHFIQQPYFADWNWEIKRQIFADNNNYLRIIILYVQAFLIFWLLILEFKILAILNFKKVVNKKFWFNEYNFLLVTISLTAFLFPSFFIQSISVFDIGQFIWILLILFSIPFGITLGSIIERYKFIGLTVTIFILIFSIGGGIYQRVPAHLGSGIIADNNESELLSQVSNLIPDDQFIIVVPNIEENELNWRGHSLIAGLTGKSVYFEDQIIKYALGDIYTKRKQNLLDLHTSLISCDIQAIEDINNRIGSNNLITYVAYPCLEDEDIVTYVEHATDLHFYILK